MKAVYNEYTDSTYTKLKPKPAFLGSLGPFINGEEGDLITVNLIIEFKTQR